MRPRSRIALTFALAAMVLVPPTQAAGDQPLACPIFSDLGERIGPQHLVTAAGRLYVTYTHTNHVGRLRFDPPNQLTLEAYVPAGGDGPHRILLRGTDLWYSMPAGVDPQPDLVGRIAVGGSIAETFPQAGQLPLCNPVGLEVGPDDQLYIGEPDKERLTRLDLSQPTLPGAITRVSLPPDFDFGGQELAAVSTDDSVWFSGNQGNWLGKIFPLGADQIGGPYEQGIEDPHAMYTGRDNLVYFTEFAAGAVSRVDPASNDIERCRLRVAGARGADIVVGPGGSPGAFEMYYTIPGTDLTKHSIGRIRVNTPTWSDVCDAQRRWEVSDGSSPKGIAVGPDNAIWFTLADDNAIGRFDLETKQILECPLPLTGVPVTCSAPIVQVPEGGGFLTNGGDSLSPSLQLPDLGDCQGISHTVTGALSGTMTDPDTGELLTLGGPVTLIASVSCETLDTAAGPVNEISLADPNLGFDWSGDGSYVRDGSGLTIAVQGLCTVGTLEYGCELIVAGPWVPHVDPLDPQKVISGTLPGATVVVRAT